jgi:starch phosphorylase
MFAFGMTDNEVLARRASYNPREACEADRGLSEAVDAVASGAYSDGDSGRHRPVVDALLSRDPFFVLADYPAYATAQRDVEARYLEPSDWARTALLNVAGMGRFSSDETIRGYSRDIWRTKVPRDAF